MKFRSLFASGFFLAATSFSPIPRAFAGEAILLIARADAEVAALTAPQAADLFLQRGAVSKLIPYDRDDPALREGFYRAVADISLTSLRAYWAKQVFTGRARPPKSLGGEDVSGVLSASPFAVTYVLAGKQPPGSKVLLKIGPSDSP